MDMAKEDITNEPGADKGATTDIEDKKCLIY